jgi:hypothetical protein
VRKPKRRAYTGTKIHPPQNRWKPPGFEHYLTITEAGLQLGKDPRWIKRLDTLGRMPEAKRVQRGLISIRLYSPDQVEEMREIFKTHKPGRKPRKPDPREGAKL